MIRIIAAAALAATMGATAEARPLEPVVVASEFAPKDLPTIVAAGAAHDALKRVQLYIGSYGINKDTAALVKTLPSARYAPILMPRKEQHSRRVISAADEARLGPEARRYAGPIPEDLMNAPEEEQRLWGVELGRRMRDRIRAAVKAGVPVDSWQLDEIFPTASKLTDRGEVTRRYQAGIVHGLAHGRPRLGDRKMKGLIFIASPGRFSKLPVVEGNGTWTLVHEIDNAAERVLGEEYPRFVGNPREVARHFAQGQLRLRERGGVWASLARKYVPTMTPGMIRYTDEGNPSALNGNVLGLPEARVAAWRRAYIDERVRIGTAGLAEYNFTHENARKAVVGHVVAALAQGADKLLDRRGGLSSGGAAAK